MKRSDFPRPLMTAVVDLNSDAAYADQNMSARPYPRLIPVPVHVTASSPRLILENWRKNVRLYPQLYFLVAHDTQAGVDNITEKAVLGVGIGLAFHDDGIVMASPQPSPRDKHMCYWYSQYTNGSQILSEDLYPGVHARDLTLTLSSPTLGVHVFPQKDLLFDPVQTLSEMSCIVSFKKHDLICLGASAAPICVPADKNFLPDEKILIDAGALGRLAITVDDRRDDTVIPTWTPRDFYLNSR